MGEQGQEYARLREAPSRRSCEPHLLVLDRQSEGAVRAVPGMRSYGVQRRVRLSSSGIYI